jgi:hypothetical protein
MSSKELARLLEKAEQNSSARDQQIMRCIQGSLNGKDIPPPFRWAKGR